jgi:anti-anti-sigma factor
MAHFATRVTVDSGRVVVALAGELDLAARDELTSTLLAAVDSGDVVVVDLGAVEFLDSSGIHALVTAHHAARRAGSELYVINARGIVAHVLDLTGLGAMLARAADGEQSRE